MINKEKNRQFRQFISQQSFIIVIMFKNSLLLTCLLSLSATVWAQKNIIKSRAIYLPGENPTYSFGLGYERKILDNLTVQLLYNTSRFTPGFDASTTESRGLVPEVRYYFGKKKDFRKKPFIGVFVEAYKFKEFGGMPQYNPDYYLVETRGNMTSAGVLIGKNSAIGKRFLIDMYIGFRYKFINGTHSFKRYSGEYFYREHTDSLPEARFGLNLGYLF